MLSRQLSKIFSRRAQASTSRERGLLHICSTLKYGSNVDDRLMADGTASHWGGLVWCWWW